MATTTRSTKGNSSRGKSSATSSRASNSRSATGSGRNSSATNDSGGSRGSQGTRRRARDSEGRYTSNSWIEAARDRPYTTAAVAAGVAGVSAFLWSRRGQISDLAETGYDRVSDLASERFGSSQDGRSQREIAEEALSLKETGDDLIDEQIAAGTVAY